MSSSDKTPVERPKGRLVVSAFCPHCRVKQEVTPAGLFALHPVKRRWKSEMCRGSGQPIRVKRQKRPTP